MTLVVMRSVLSPTMLATLSGDRDFLLAIMLVTVSSAVPSDDNLQMDDYVVYLQLHFFVMCAVLFSESS